MHLADGTEAMFHGEADELQFGIGDVPILKGSARRDADGDTGNEGGDVDLFAVVLVRRPPEYVLQIYCP